MGFPKKEYQGGLPFHSPGDFPDPVTEPMSPALAGKFFTTEPPGKPKNNPRQLLDRVWIKSLPPGMQLGFFTQWYGRGTQKSFWLPFFFTDHHISSLSVLRKLTTGTFICGRIEFQPEVQFYFLTKNLAIQNNVKAAGGNNLLDVMLLEHRLYWCLSHSLLVGKGKESCESAWVGWTLASVPFLMWQNLIWGGWLSRKGKASQVLDFKPKKVSLTTMGRNNWYAYHFPITPSSRLMPGFGPSLVNHLPSSRKDLVASQIHF